MKLVLDYDDFHWKSPENCLEIIVELKYRFPKIKINLFTVPKHSEYPIQANQQWCNEVRKLIESGNIQLCPHGYKHSHLEFAALGLQETNDRLGLIQLFFEKAKLPFAKVFKGPNWGINQYTYEALIEVGYTHIFSHPDYNHLRDPRIKTVVYNWNLKDEFIGKEDLVIGHGHTWNVCDNGIAETIDRLSDFIHKYKPEFLFADEV